MKSEKLECRRTDVIDTNEIPFAIPKIHTECQYYVASLPGPAQLFVACMQYGKAWSTNSDRKLGGAWERG